jgi:multidrug efflux pump subunit AcrB
MNLKNSQPLGFAGRLAKIFLHSKLTPVIAVGSILLGLVAVVLTPKEEEPQISVPMIDVSIGAPGFEAAEIERKVTEPIERALWGLDGVEYVYSASKAHGALITARFKVGQPMEPSLVKVHHQLMTIRDQLPSNASQPQVTAFSIDDVPFLTLTFSSAKISPYELRSLIAPLAREFSSTPDLSRVELKGGLKRALRVVVNPAALKKNGLSLLTVANALEKSNVSLPAGKNWSDTHVYDVDVGGRITNAEEMGAIALGQRGGRVVSLRDIAKITDGPEEMTRASILFEKSNNLVPENAVSIVFAKRKGTNVVALSQAILERAHVFSKALSPDIHMSEVRNYGATAGEKAKELIEHLLIATLSVAALIALVMGIRASIVVAIAIPVTLALTLAVYYFLGYTLNRITLFALIFSIGILVDDAIVVVENIERHLDEKPEMGIVRATLDAVSEVGNPTILATFAVIAAILPMAFVRGMMGPYMKPIPVGASLAMILSLLVAFIVTPWASVRIIKRHEHKKNQAARSSESKLDRIYQSVMSKLLESKVAVLKFGLLTLGLFAIAFSLVYFKAVKVKMLPFDNKNEFQVLIDFQNTTPLKVSLEKAKILSLELLKSEEVKKIQIFAGESAPFSFSGMVKHTFLRGGDDQVDLQVVLSEKGERKESSHEIIEKLRPIIAQFGENEKAITKVLETPPGPPVLSTMIAEVYGPTREVREQVAGEIYNIFKAEKSVVDLDTTSRLSRPRTRYSFDYLSGGKLGANAEQFATLGHALFSESKIGLLKESTYPEEVEINLSVEQNVRSGTTPLQNQLIPSFETGLVSASLLSQKPEQIESPTLYRKNLKPVSYVTSELSGSEEAPVYGILKLAPQIHYPTQTAEVPWNTSAPVVKWDGEWFITYEVFRDLGGAFAAVILLIYILVLGWFRSYAVPLVIMAPIPISLIGILPGHAIMGAYFTATSMIGFIAGAGIIVRNSIILVDFIEHQLKRGMALKEAVISAGVLRFRPMLLTAAAVVVGSAVMLADPIFQGLAISLMFGEVAATLLSRFAVPVLYYWFLGKKRERFLQNELKENVVGPEGLEP